MSMLFPVKSITFINQTLGVGGAETFTHGLFDWLTAHNVRIDIYSTNLLAYPKARQIPLVIDVIGDWIGLVKGICLLPLGIWYYGYLVWKCRSTDLILMTGFIEKILVTPWAKLLGIAVIWVEYAPLQSVFSLFGGLPKWMYLQVVGMPDLTIVPSVNTLRSTAGPRKVVIPCAFKLKKKYQYPKTTLSVCCVSRLEKGKGQDLLIKAWRDVVAQVPRARLRIVGQGDQYQNLKFQISNLKLSSSVMLVGWVPDSLTEMAKSRLVVFPTLWSLEGFGLVAVEAMSLGKPVVGFKYGPVPEIVTPGCGILVAPGDTQALARAIIDLLTHPGKLRQMGKLARQRYLKNYTFDQIGHRYLQAFERACATILS